MASTSPTTLEKRSPIQPTNSENDSLSDLREGTEPISNVCFIGAGHVGGTAAAVTAYHNPHLLVTRWNSKHLPIFEPSLREVVRIARDGARPLTVKGAIVVPERSPNLFFSSSNTCIGEADIIFITVNTPTKASGRGEGYATDMAALEAAVKEIGLHARRGTIIVEKSTLTDYRLGQLFDIVSNPEFLSAGTAVKDLMDPDRVLIGCSPTPAGHRAASTLADLYAGYNGSWVSPDRIMRTNVWSSELSKLVTNSMLAQRISSINSISAIYEKTDAEIEEVATAIGCDSRIGDRFLKAGIGFGGSCFKKDILSLIYLAQSLGLEEVAEYWQQVIKMNDYQRARFAGRVVQCLNNTLTGKKITFLGYAFKGDTSDTRGSPTLEVIKTLQDEDPAEIAIFDPYCDNVDIQKELEALCIQGRGCLTEKGTCHLSVYSNVYEACRQSSALLITTEHECFVNSVRPFRANGGEEYSDTRPCLSPWPTRLKVLEALVQRACDEPSCADGCAECKHIESRGDTRAELSSGSRGLEDVEDWRRMIDSMAKPRWLFDGRGIIDPKEMAKLNIRVESIGRRSLRWDEPS
ncbi:nucleotide sugar dehydrogenase [Xylariaceae sp. FL0594]|nr:nucleotide sugar dehydrogenase [Xylariaceae sp. FL0594]